MLPLKYVQEDSPPRFFVRGLLHLSLPRCRFFPCGIKIGLQWFIAIP